MSPSPSAAAEHAASGAGAGVPRHVAIIMDGNGRWAKARLLPRLAGHRKGVEAVRRVARAARDAGVEVLTLYAFSSENWRRPAEEVSDLMGLLRHFIRNDIDEMVGEGIRLAVIGDYRALAPDIVTLIDDAVARTAHNTGPLLVIALNYGSQAEIAGAVRDLATAARDGTLDPRAIDEAAVERALASGALPPVDLLIRTSGEQRLSNFLLWQAAYAELLFVDTLWPDFDAAHLTAALDDFARRQRRFGGL